MNNDEDIIEFEHIDAEEQDKEQDIAKYKLNTYGADFTLEVLNNKIREKEIVIPPFQRRYVWDQKKASKLIESFLLGLPVPQIFLYREEEKQDLLVVDGQQRLKSISFFFEEKFEITPEITDATFAKALYEIWFNNASSKRSFLLFDAGAGIGALAGLFLAYAYMRRKSPRART